MQSTKERIRKVVQEYIKMFPLEYADFLKSVRVKQETKKNDWAEFKNDGTSQQMVRQLLEMPETLYLALRQQMKKEELDWLYAREAHINKRDGMTWFLKNFPQFKITKDS